jgi:pimeloyl-ACP methyl ester carboxylesterase
LPTRPINGIRIHWEITGKVGEPMVLVHGSWGDHGNWSTVAPVLGSWFRVLTYDRRGHSRSERPAGQGSVHEDVADLAALLTELRHTPAHVVGSSFGAAIVLRLAADRPALFRSLVVHEPPLFGLLKEEPGGELALAAVQGRIASVVSLLTAGDWEGGARQFVETVGFGPGAWTELPEEVRRTFVFNAPTWLDEMRDPDALEMDVSGLRAFSPPALLTVGDRSPPFFRRVVEMIAGAMPQAEVHTYPGAGHAPHLTHTEQYLRRLTTFLAPRSSEG